MTLDSRDWLLIIDPQIDFCPGGALPVPEGDQVIAPINALAARFSNGRLSRCVISQDWHPKDHASFASQHGVAPFSLIHMPYGEQVAWPDHCVQGTRGAELHPELTVPNAPIVIRKGANRDIDSYSAFLENDHVTATGLEDHLKRQGARRLFLAGLALDYCVRFTAEDAAALGFDAVVIADACRAIAEPSATAAMQSFKTLGVQTAAIGDVLAA
jgi:nicotinamidase/pyrazinamidase